MSSTLTPDNARQVMLNSPVLSQRKLRQLLTLRRFRGREHAPGPVPRAWRDARGRPAPPVRARPSAPVRAGKILLLLSDRYPGAGLPADPCAARHRRDPPPPGRGRPALRLQPDHRDRHRARPAPDRLPDRCRRDGGLSLPRLPDAVGARPQRHLLEGKRGNEAAELGRSYRRGIKKGLLKILSKMGISTHRQLSRRAAVRNRRPAPTKWSTLCFPGIPLAHRRRGLRRPRGRRAQAGRARLVRAATTSSRAACSSTCTAANTTCTTRT